MLQIIFSGFITSTTIFMLGRIFLTFLKIEDKKLDFIDLTLTGLFCFGVSSVLINFFFPLNKLVNTFTYIIIILAYFYIFKLKKFNQIIIFALFVSIISTFMLIKTDVYNPDSYLYHLPYIKILMEHKFIVGLANIHSRFGHVSIFQNISASNVNYINDVYGILTIQLCLFSAILLEFIKNIKENYYIKKFDIIFYFCFFSILFCLIRFYRFNDFGNDALVHLTTIVLIFYILNFSQFKRKLIILIPLTCVFLFTQKIFYLVILGIPFILFFFIKNIKNYIKKNFYLIPIVLLFFLKSFLTTGCVIYPLPISCFEQVDWYNINSGLNASNVSLSSEAWSKSWNTQTKMSMTEYISGFNWFENWKINHFDKTIKMKISIFIFVIIFSFIISYILEKNIKYIRKNCISIIKNKLILIFSLYLILCLIIWFLKFPIFRYGLSFIFYILFLAFFFLTSTKIFNKIFIISLIGISLIFFISKNTQRIFSDNLSTKEKVFVKGINKKDFYKKKIYSSNSDEFLFIYFSDGECGFYNSPCTNYFENSIKLKSYGKYKIITN